MQTQIQAVPVKFIPSRDRGLQIDASECYERLTPNYVASTHAGAILNDFIEMYADPVQFERINNRLRERVEQITDEARFANADENTRYLAMNKLFPVLATELLTAHAMRNDKACHAPGEINATISTQVERTYRFDNFSFVADAFYDVAVYTSQDIVGNMYLVLDFVVITMTTAGQASASKKWNSFVNFDQLAMLARQIAALSVDASTSLKS